MELKKAKVMELNASIMAMAIIVMLLSVLSGTHAVKYGIEHFTDDANGVFAAFGNGYVSFVDAESKEIIKTLTTDSNGKDLVNQAGDPISWADSIYMECPVSPGSDELRSLIFANQRDSWTVEDDVPNTDELFTNEPFSYVSVIDTDAMEIIGEVKVGPRPIHAYAVPWRNEFWTHIDGRAEFDVIHCDDIFNTAVERIAANVESAGHGKLLVHPDLNNTAYATHVGEAYIFEIDMETKQLVDSHPIEGVESCSGLHAVDYTPVSQHLFAECTGEGGMIEFDVTTDTVIHQWLGETGALYESPDGGFIISANKDNSLFHILQPQANGEKATKAFADIQVPKPGSPIFYPNGKIQAADDPSTSFEDYIVFLPLINNPSRNYVECVYGSDGRTLAVDDDGNTITPNCGSCNPDPQYDGRLSGFAYFDIADLVDVNSQPNDPEIISAGGIEPTAPYPYSPECGYGRTYRKAARGGKWILSGADFDNDYGEPAIAIIDAEARALHGFIPTESRPTWIVYIPSEKGLLPETPGGDGKNDE